MNKAPAIIIKQIIRILFNLLAFLLITNTLSLLKVSKDVSIDTVWVLRGIIKVDTGVPNECSLCLSDWTLIYKLISKEDYASKKEALERERRDLEVKITNCKNKSQNTSDTIKDRVTEIKKIIKDNLDYKRGTLNDELIDTFIDKIVVHNDKLEWHLNYLNNIMNNEKGKESSESNNEKILLTKYSITLDDVIEYTRFDKDLRTVKFNKPLLIEVYI